MSLTLSSQELEHLAQAVELLVSPLAHPGVDEWRTAVNRHLKGLLHADSAGFLLPVPDGLMMFSEEHDPAELASYPDYPPPPLVDGTPIWEVMVRSGVNTSAEAYGANYDGFLNSPYYQEYAGANGAHDALIAAVSLGGTDAHSMASLNFWHARLDRRPFGQRELAMLRLLFPAFRAGVETFVRWGPHRLDLFNALDAIGQSALVVDPAGLQVHRTPALRAMLGEDREQERIVDAMLAVATAVRHATCAPGVGLPTPVVRQLRTVDGEYVVRGSLYGGLPAGAVAHVLVALERATPRLRTAEELQEVDGLTRAETRVAAHLARGASNAQIAESLRISPHTARRHTEQVMRKLGVRSRAEVASRVMR